VSACVRECVSVSECVSASQCLRVSTYGSVGESVSVSL